MDILTIPRVMTAVAEWSSCMTMILLLKKRFSRIKTIGISGIFLLIQCLFLQFTGGYDFPPIWIGCMLIATALMIGFLYTAASIQPIDAVCWYAIAFMCAEFMASLAWGIICYVDRFGWNQLWVRILMAGCIYAVCLISMYLIERKMLTQEYMEHVTVKTAIWAVIFAAIFFILANISFIDEQAPFATVNVADIFNYRIFLDFGGCAVLLLYQTHEYEHRQRLELQAMSQTLMSQYHQYRDYQQTMELVHIMKHDLKHQIEGLRGVHDAAVRDAWLDEMEKNLDEMELIQDTGNAVLNTIIGAKMVAMKKYGIRFTYLINGKKLNFMHVIDICSIFGNALDNAIECVCMVPDEEKRMIHIKVSEHRQFVYVEIGNYTEMETKNWEGRFPKTTKADKQEHGYGLKSIVQVTEKYGGTVSADIEDHWFVLRLLFPV